MIECVRELVNADVSAIGSRMSVEDAAPRERQDADRTALRGRVFVVALGDVSLVVEVARLAHLDSPHVIEQLDVEPDHEQGCGRRYVHAHALVDDEAIEPDELLRREHAGVADELVALSTVELAEVWELALDDVPPGFGHHPKVVARAANDGARAAVSARLGSMQTLPGNQEAIEAWNTVLFDKFVRYRPILTTGLAQHGNRAIAQLALKPGARVVDIGCGFGDTTQVLGKIVGPSGRALGVDAAARFIDIARTEAAGLEQVSFEVADVESRVPGGPYDAAFSRMGTMFFNQPVFALRNIRKVLAPGAPLKMVVWRKKETNEAMYNAELIVRELLGDPPKNDQVTCGPGPFSMASADLVSDQLIGAGFRNISFERSDADMLFGQTIAEAIDFALSLGPAGEVVRLAGDEAVKRRAEIEQALATAIEAYKREDGSVFAPTSCWIVTAHAPS
jgi:ubiquinone/menaquinone biosynthesis C-methylase UbiE